MSTQQPFIDYRSYQDNETARELLLNILDQNNIPYEVEITHSELNVYTGKASWIPPVVVKIQADNFEKVNALIETDTALVTIPERHFLISFSNEELTDVLQKQDEWGTDNYNIARKLLEQRGKPVPQAALDKYKTERMEALAKPTTVEPVWLSLAFASAIAGGIFAIIFGRMIYTSTKILPNGKRVYVYDAASRKNGFALYMIGIAVLALYIAILFVVAIK